MPSKIDPHSLNAGKEHALAGHPVDQKLLDEGYYHKASYMRGYGKNASIKEHEHPYWNKK